MVKVLHPPLIVLLSHPFQYIFPLSFSPHLLVCYFSSTVNWETDEQVVPVVPKLRVNRILSEDLMGQT